MTRTAAIVFAVAAVGVLAFTALVDSQARSRPTARPASPAPRSTADVPGTVASDAPDAARSRTWLRPLRGRWARDPRNNYFQFGADGTGVWVAYGQRLWTGRAAPRDARTFDLFDTQGHGGGAYWQVRLVGGGNGLLFAGTQQVYRKVA